GKRRQRSLLILFLRLLRRRHFLGFAPSVSLDSRPLDSRAGEAATALSPIYSCALEGRRRSSSRSRSRSNSRRGGNTGSRSRSDHNGCCACAFFGQFSIGYEERCTQDRCHCHLSRTCYYHSIDDFRRILRSTPGARINPAGGENIGGLTSLTSLLSLPS